MDNQALTRMLNHIEVVEPQRVLVEATAGAFVDHAIREAMIYALATRKDVQLVHNGHHYLIDLDDLINTYRELKKL